MQRFPQFPEYSVEFWNPRASQFLQNCKLRLTQRTGHTDEVDGYYKTPHLQSPSFLSQTLQQWPSQQKSGIQSPSHWIPSLAVLPVFLRKELAIVKYFWAPHCWIHWSSRDIKAPRARHKMNLWRVSPCWSFPSWRAGHSYILHWDTALHGESQHCGLPQWWKIREVQAHDGTHPIWS